MRSLIANFSFGLFLIAAPFLGAYFYSGLPSLPGYLIFHGPVFKEGDIIVLKNGGVPRKITRVGIYTYSVSTEDVSEDYPIKVIDMYYIKK